MTDKLYENPICVLVENTSEKEQIASVFSLMETNENIKIKSMYDNVTYDFIKLMLLKESYLIGQTRVNCSSNILLENIIRINHKNIQSHESEFPFPLIKEFDLLQFKEAVIDISKPFYLYAGTSLNINMKPHQIIQLHLFPALKFYGSHSDEIKTMYALLTEKYENGRSQFEFLTYLKTHNITGNYWDASVKTEDKEVKEYTIQPEWEMGITHIRTIGFYPENIIIGDKIIKSEEEFEGEMISIGLPIFCINEVEAHTPMKIKIPNGIDGYILFFRDKQPKVISYK